MYKSDEYRTKSTVIYCWAKCTFNTLCRTPVTLDD